MIGRFLIFGATGDLTSRHLVPALARLLEAGALPDLALVAVAGAPLTDGEYRARVMSRLAPTVRNRDSCAQVLGRTVYRRADVTDSRQLTTVLATGGAEPAVVYLALPPRIVVDAARALVELGLPPGSRVVFEKPFGVDAASARTLNALMARAFGESAVFRMDHFLGMHSIQNILELRFANRIFEYLWNREHIERIDIVWDEILAMEQRGPSYDGTGALRDMMQNHLLQILALLAMEAPASVSARDLRDRKVDVLRAVAPPAPERTVRARYTRGRIGDREVPSYVDERGVRAARNTETFAQATLFVRSWRWADIPFVLRTGKALSRPRREAVVRFRPVPHLAFERSCPEANLLRLELLPDHLRLVVNGRGRSHPFAIEHMELHGDLAQPDLPAYATLLLDILRGDTTLSIRGDEAEESWRIVEPILDAWAKDRVPLLEYPAGSEGPPSRSPP